MRAIMFIASLAFFGLAAYSAYYGAYAGAVVVALIGAMFAAALYVHRAR